MLSQSTIKPNMQVSLIKYATYLLLEVGEGMEWLIVLIDGLDHFLYMYKRERVSILEGTQSISSSGSRTK